MNPRRSSVASSASEVNYFLDPRYKARLDPDYFQDEGMDAVWQPDVYADAADLAERLASTKIIDLGCGDGSKLVALHPQFEIVGVDYGPNIEGCRKRYDVGAWIEFDLDSDDPLPLQGFEGSVLVCADVIEHLVYPERLLRRVRNALDHGGDALVLSTPERDLANGPGHLGPPSNRAHVREWNTEELRNFLRAEGLDGNFGLTRSNDHNDQLLTILAVAAGTGPSQAATVRAWARDYSRWQERAEEHAWKVKDLQARHDALGAELERHKQILERHKEILSLLRASRWLRIGARLGARVNIVNQAADKEPDAVRSTR